MANVKSAKKRVKTNLKKELRNHSAKSSLRSALKKVSVALDAKNLDTARESLPGALRAIGKSCRKGLIHKNKAARQESRLMKRLSRVSAETAK